MLNDETPTVCDASYEQDPIDFEAKIVDIRNILTEDAALCQLAEECGELIQAVMKLVRINDGNNPTPKTRGEVKANIIEEITDIYLCIKVLGYRVNFDFAEYKAERWANRLNEAERNKNDYETELH